MQLKPTFALSSIFESYRFLNAEKDSAPITIFPDAAGCMVIYLNDHNVTKIMLWGPMSIARHLPFKKGIKGHKLLLIEFWPMGMKKFFGKIDRNLQDIIIDLKDIFPRYNNHLISLLNKEGLAQLETILGKINQNTTLKATQLYYDILNDQAVLYYSKRHANRLLANDVGLSAKQIKRIKRFYKALSLLKSDYSLDKIAWQTGYYDNAHLIKDFDSIANIKPSDYRFNKSDFYSEINKIL